MFRVRFMNSGVFKIIFVRFLCAPVLQPISCSFITGIDDRGYLFHCRVHCDGSIIQPNVYNSG